MAASLALCNDSRGERHSSGRRDSVNGGGGTDGPQPMIYKWPVNNKVGNLISRRRLETNRVRRAW